MTAKSKILLFGICLFWQSLAFGGRAEIVFGVTPWEKPETLQSYYQPLISYFESKLQTSVKLVVTHDYDGLMTSLKQNDIQFALCSPKIYVKIKKDLPQAHYLVTIINKDEAQREQDYYKGVIAVRKDSGTKDLQSPKNKKFAFTNRESSSGFLFPNDLLKSKKIAYETFFSEVFWLENHSRVVAALANKSVDAIATWDGGLLAGQKEFGDIFDVLVETQPIPSDAVVAAERVEKKLAQQVENLLLGLQAEKEVIAKMNRAGFKIAGFKKRSDKFYDVIRRVYLAQ